MKIQHLSHLEGVAPTEPHLILYTESGPAALATAIPPGARMGVVARFNERDPLHDLILMKVTRDELVFHCRCHPKCSRVYTWKRSFTGGHPQGMHVYD